MSLNRRNFILRSASSGAGAICAAVAPSASAEVREERKLPPKAVGLLFDATLCIGCKACVVACRGANHTHPEFSTEEKLWDTPLDLSADTLTVIKAYSQGTGVNKDQEQDGYEFIKKSCLHCVDPSCVSVCPVTAMTKDPETGIVSYNVSRCIGCRYCVAACPFGVPRFEYEETFPRLRKCELCKERLAVGNIPACAEVCPTGATLFGPVRELSVEARRRHQLTTGERAFFPRKTVDSDDVTEKPAPHYVDETYGATQVGGTQVQFLSGVPFEKLGYPVLRKNSFVSTSETVQHTLYKGMIAPAVLFGCLLFFTRRATKHEEEDKPEKHGPDQHIPDQHGPDQRGDEQP